MHSRNNPLPPVLQHLRRDSVRELLDGTGHPYRWTVPASPSRASTTLRACPQHGSSGHRARAVRVLERLQPPYVDLFFRNITPTSVGSDTQQVRPDRLLNRIIPWVNGYCRTHRLHDTIPDVDDSPWHLNSRQFRRTLAWYVARRPRRRHRRRDPVPPPEHQDVQESGRQRPSALRWSLVVNPPRDRPRPSPPAPPPPGGRAGSATRSRPAVLPVRPPLRPGPVADQCGHQPRDRQTQQKDSEVLLVLSYTDITQRRHLVPGGRQPH